MVILSTFAIFAKFWEKGKVKTRLAQTVGNAAAAKLYLLFLKVSIHKARHWKGRKLLCFSPSDRENEFRQLAPEWELMPQHGSELGERMRNLFDSVLMDESSPSSNSSANSLVLIGSDSPLLPEKNLLQANQALQNHDVVIGPSHDGGYYLIGARNKTPDIFTDIEWSTENVYEQTVDRLRSGGYDFATLDTQRDIDDEEDLIWMMEELQRLDPLPPEWQPLLEASRQCLDQSASESNHQEPPCE